MKRLAVVGHPVAHSRSPAMHTAALADLGLAGEWSYEAIDLAPDEFESRVRAMMADDFVGAMTSAYRRVGDSWRLALYQQTAVADA